jgi:protein-S-isoprenylcysteine O-methyltransferase Ste14
VACLAAGLNALLLFIALALAGFFAVWDSGNPPVDELARQPEGSLQPASAVFLAEYRSERNWSPISFFRASVDRYYRSDLSGSAIRDEYAAQLSARGWVPEPSMTQVETNAAWCRGQLTFTIYWDDGDSRLHTRLESRHRFQSCPAAGRFPDATVSFISVGSFVAFVVAAQVVRRRNIARRDKTIARDRGIAHLATYFVWVPYAVIALRPGPTFYVPDPIQLSGLLLIVGGIAFALWAMLTLGRHYDLELEVHKDHQIVRAGPYRLVRHPVYLGVGLHLLGAALASGNVAVAACVLLGAFPVFYLRARAEERLLRQHFGPAYDEYARKVGMLVPLL